MIDENLPAFFYKNSPDGLAHHTGVFLSHRGSEPALAYSLKHGDPAAATARNRYAAGLFDSANPDVLFGEVLITPEWTQPSLSQEEIRRNNGVTPPPSPLLPTSFTVQLYNPDLQVTVTQKPGSWGGSASYEFSLPQLTFRTPSASTLDRSQNDPAASMSTPKLNFVWRKESKLAKDLTCFMTGKSTDQIAKKKSRDRDPDIAVALYRSLRELTIYEPNLYRVELEDPKGLELVLLLSAAVIKDLYFSNDLGRLFNVYDPARLAALEPIAAAPSPRQSASLATKRKSLPRLRTTPSNTPSPLPTTQAPDAAPAAPDARTQWELDAETARLRAQVEAEEREARMQEAARRRERERADEAETHRLRKMVEDEEREARRRGQEDVDRETERLKQQYRLNPPSPPATAHRHSDPSLPLGNSNNQLRPQSRPHPAASSSHLPVQNANPLYMQPNPSSYSSFANNSVLMSGANPHLAPTAPKMKKKSFWGLRTHSDQGSSKLSKKASAVS